MSIFFSKKNSKPDESFKNRKIDIFNPKSADFIVNDIKTKQPIEITTERKKLELQKDSQSIENNNTSVDVNSNYGEENLDIKNLPNFKSHLSELKFIFNSKENTTISKDVKNSKFSENVKNSEKDELKHETINNNQKIEIKSNNEIFLGYNYLINQIYEKDSYNNGNTCYKSISYNSNQKTLKEIINLKDIYNQNEFDYNERNNLYRTSVIYENKESNLLIRAEYLYILEIKANPKNDNPDLSLINQLEKEEKENDKINSLKKAYDISHPLICLNFNLLSCKLLLNKKDVNKNNGDNYEIQIVILGTNRKIIFYIKNYEVYKRFAYIIGQKIYNSEGYKMNKMGLCLRNNFFYKDIYITVSEFESIAKTGDMLLFITMDCLSDLQKCFTRDQYDHIALIIINEGELEILEATVNEKCNLLKWRRFKYFLFNLMFKKIALRRLNIEEKDPKKVAEIRQNIEERSKDFIKKILKKEYEMSLLKMAFSAKPQEYEINGEWEKGTGYCCSALNAAFYIYNGIMKLEKSVHSIRPGDFEQDKNRLTLMPGFSFGPEKIIEFST